MEPTERQGALPALHVTQADASGRPVIQWIAGAAGKDSFAPIVVPQDQLLMLGDNRDNSADSRCLGLGPRRLLIGQAKRILVSAGVTPCMACRYPAFSQNLAFDMHKGSMAFKTR